MEPNNSPLLVDVKTAATLLCVSRTTLYQLMAKGDLHPVKLGRATRVSVKELEDFVAEQTDRAA